MDFESFSKHRFGAHSHFARPPFSVSSSLFVLFFVVHQFAVFLCKSFYSTKVPVAPRCTERAVHCPSAVRNANVLFTILIGCISPAYGESVFMWFATLQLVLILSHIHMCMHVSSSVHGCDVKPQHAISNAIRSIIYPSTTWVIAYMYTVWLEFYCARFTILIKYWFFLRPIDSNRTHQCYKSVR